MTNVKPSELNYDKYATDKYDRDIVNSIPFHREIHGRISDFVKSDFDANKEYDVLDLGTGTGITAEIMRSVLPKARIDVVDFSKQMLAGAKKDSETKMFVISLAITPTWFLINSTT